MRVALVSYYYPEFTLAEANALAAQGVQVLLVAPRAPLMPYRHTLSPAVEPHLFDGRRLRDPLNVLDVWQLVTAIKRWRPDVIHLQQGQLWFNLIGLPLLAKYPLVTTVHDVVSHPGDGYARRTPQWIWDIAMTRADQLIVQGQALRQQLMERHQLPAEKIHLVPHGQLGVYADWAQADAALPPTDADRILFFGRIWPYKGLQYLIQAEPLITAEVPTARIVIAGEGESLEPYRRLMAHPEHFEIHNHFLSPPEVARFFQQAAVVALPYVEASQSGVVPIACAFGKPVVASRVGSLAELVDDAETGFLVPPRDVPRLVQAIVTLLKDKALRQHMGDRARLKANTDLSWDKRAEKVRAVYQAALAA